MKFYPYKRGGAEKVLAMLKGGTQSFEVVFTQELEVLAIVMGEGGHKRFPLLRGGGAQQFYPVLRGGAQKGSDPRFSHFVAPLSHS